MKIFLILVSLFHVLSALAAPDYKKISETNLYSDIETHTLNPEISLYSPQYPLWTDGALKKRFVYLPPNSQINTSNMDRWIYPNGTKVWKEFSFRTSSGDKRIETRLIEKGKDGTWYYFVFVWNKDETEAHSAPREGIKNHVPINDQVSHDIPSINQCQACHGFQNEPLMSFAALQLSPIRDPSGLHQDQVTPDMINLKDLVEQNKITHAPQEWPIIKSDNAKERAVMGYLHGNCSSCHRPDGAVGKVGMNLLYRTDSEHELQGYFRTAVNIKTTKYQIPGQSGSSYRIKMGSPDQSAILFRTNTREEFHRMLPFGSKLVDEKFVKVLKEYLQEN